MLKYKAKFNVMIFTELIVFICEVTQTANLPPWITAVFEPEYYVPASDPTPFILQCKAKNGIISYQWFKNNVKLQTNNRVVVNGQSGEITFRNLTEEDFGMYHCLVNNEFGASVSLFVKLNKAGNLHFLNINRTYENHNLSCGIWNEKLRRFAKGTSYTVLVNDNNNTAISKAIWKNNPKARIGENATLHCIFSGSPVPDIHWLLRNGSVIKPNSKFNIEENGRQLLIRNVTFDDDGVYTCVAKSNLTMNPYLNVTTPPIFVDVGYRFMMTLIQLSHMEDIEIQCNAISAPNESDPVVIQWMRNGRNINKDPLYRFSEEKKNLHIGINVPISENGDCFTCVIENSEGIGVANFILTSKDRDQKVNYVVITVCSIAMVTLINIGVFIMRKKLICKTKVKNIPEEVVEAKEEPVYSDPVIELSENMYIPNCDEEVSYDTPQMISIDDDPGNDYNALREYKVEQVESNFYDCAENVSGIYNISFRGNPQTILGFSVNLGSEGSCTDT